MDWVDQCPTEPIARKTFESLDEYSMSAPTGVFPGKVWRRNVGLTEPPTWVVCEYVPSGPDRCRVDYRRPVIQEPPL